MMRAVVLLSLLSLVSLLLRLKNSHSRTMPLAAPMGQRLARMLTSIVECSGTIPGNKVRHCDGLRSSLRRTRPTHKIRDAHEVRDIRITFGRGYPG
jgi:hypothetical protein